MDTNINPKISIITITRNRAGFISKAIESAQKQGFSNWELLVLDDDSNDGTRAILEAFTAKDERIRYYKNSLALGISKNRNMGLSLASGKYIAVLDSDDEWIDKDKLSKSFDFLENNPDYVLIGSNIKIVDEKGNFIKNTDFATDDENIRKKILIKNQIPHSTVIFRKDLVDKIGGYDNRLSCVEDLDLFLKLGKLGKMKNLKEITTSYTKHSQSTSQRKKMAMAWNHLWIVFRNFGEYPNWFIAMFFAKLRILKNLF
ncbi:MAG: glycosyltransferase family 2 protein [bacterium]